MVSVSIITPSYNCSRYISEAILSVQGQTFYNWEMIIVDDCSLDNSVEIIKSFAAQDSRIKLIQLSENSGAAVARNMAIEAAEGRYIAFLDSDDMWLSSKLESQIQFMQNNNYPFTFSAYNKVNEENLTLGHVGVPEVVSYSDILKMCSIGCLTAVYDTDYFEKMYMPLIRKRQDLGLWLRLLKKVDFAYGLNVTLAQYRVHPSSISANKINSSKFTWHVYREIENLNIFSAIYYFCHYAIRGTLRVKFPSIAILLGILKK